VESSSRLAHEAEGLKETSGRAGVRDRVIKFTTDRRARGRVELGRSDMTMEIRSRSSRPLEGQGLRRTTHRSPTSDDLPHDVDRCSTSACAGTGDVDQQEALTEKLLRGGRTPIDTLQAPSYAAYDASIKVLTDPKQAAA